jgi:hypothetical protein
MMAVLSTWPSPAAAGAVRMILLLGHRCAAPLAIALIIFTKSAIIRVSPIG